MLHHVIRGEQPTETLLLHGFLGRSANLGALIRGRPGGAVAADLPGHGESPPLGPEDGLEQVATAVLELVDHLEMHGAHLIGHSLGGRVGLMARRLAPNAFGKITLLDITPSPIEARAESLAGVRQALLDAPEQADAREKMRAFFLERDIERPIVDWLMMNLRRWEHGVRWSIDRARLLAFDRRASPEDLWDVVDETVRCIRGGASPYVSDVDAQRFEAAGATVHTIEGAGHFVHVDARDRVLELLG